MMLCILAGNFDPLIFVGVMPLGIFVYVNFFINEITASDAGPDIIRSHLFSFKKVGCNPSIEEIFPLPETV